jgi:hypothetical protein
MWINLLARGMVVLKFFQEVYEISSVIYSALTKLDELTRSTATRPLANKGPLNNMIDGIARFTSPSNIQTDDDRVTALLLILASSWTLLEKVPDSHISNAIRQLNRDYKVSLDPELQILIRGK